MVRQSKTITASEEDYTNSEPDNTLTKRELSISEMRDIASIDDAIALYERLHGQPVVEAHDEIGDGFDFTENKDSLVGRPLFLLKWELSYSSSYTRDGSPIRTAQVWAVSQDSKGFVRKARFSDFSTGVCQQLWEFSERTNRYGGLRAPLGLRKSEFQYEDPNTGQRSQAATYYLDLSREL